ncbi:low affinity immunoglobulin epsilon Fc receptor isoform X2 [Perognathus longimembris pacificus]|nr:low affinity immunoglobulin epsilon Fc receptor isoform X2 [Perognathus longimembris pacificus]XP_048196831.1 low affinity immunoglobulin epsilon Fc receptor isoform X2 [Perognathus longimembris pacificus]
MVVLWAGVMTLLFLWHWDTVRNLKQVEDVAAHSLKQVEDAAAQNVSLVSKDLQKYQSDQIAQKLQAIHMAQNMQELQAEQKQMKSQDSHLAWNLQRMQEDLTQAKSLSLNERRTVSNLLENLQEAVRKLWVEIRMAKGSACSTCPEQWLNFQQKCYYFGEGTKRWLQARFACSDLEGRLVSIHSQEEQDFLSKHTSKDSWIGLQDLDVEGDFVWMDRSPVSYSNWLRGEPNNSGLDEHCVMMRASGHWNDVFCRSQLDAWVCEQLATCGPPTPSTSGGPTPTPTP